MNNSSVEIIYWTIVIACLVLQPVIDSFFTRKKHYWSGVIAAHACVLLLWPIFYLILRSSVTDDPLGEGFGLAIIGLGGFSLFAITIYGIISLGINILLIKDIKSFRSNPILRYRPWLSFGILVIVITILNALSGTVSYFRVTN